MTYFVYILQSATTMRYYIGQTDNLSQRLNYHNLNYVKATKHRGPWKLVYFETFPTRGQAMSRERHLKRLKDRRIIAQMVERSGCTG